VESLEFLVKQLKTIEGLSESDGNIGSFIFFPISHLLRKEQLGDRTTELVLQVLDFLYKNCWKTLMSLKGTKEHMSIVVYLMSGPPADPNADEPRKEFLEISNETKAAGCKALDALYSAAFNSRSIKFSETFPITAHNISVLISCLRYSTDGAVYLQLAAIDTLTNIYRIVDDGDILSLVLPATVSTITGLIIGRFGGRCNYKVVAEGLNFLKEVLVTIFKDSELFDGEGMSDKNRNRTKSWLEASKAQVKIALNTLSAMRNHSRKEVQLAFSEMCFSILNNCEKSLDVCVEFCMDTLVFFSSTDFDVHKKARSYLSFVLTSETLQTVLSDRVYDWINSLPRVFSSHDEKQPVMILNAIQTGIDLLEELECDKTASLREVFVSNLQNSISLDANKSSSQAGSLDEFDPTKSLVEVSPQIDRPFTFDGLGVMSNISMRTQKALYSLLSYVGGFPSSSNKLIEMFLGDATQSEEKTVKLVSLWATVTLFKGAVNKALPSTTEDKENEMSEWLVGSDSNNPQQEVSGELTDAAIDLLSAFHELLDSNSSIQNSVDSDNINNALVGVSLEGLSAVARYLGTEFQFELVDNIYSIVHFLGSPNYFVRRHAQDAVVQITQSLGYSNVRSLLIDNADYLVDGISLKLNTLDISPQTPAILTTLISLVGSAIGPYLDDLVATMFVILDNYHGYSQLTEGIFQVFRSLVEETYKGYSNQLLIQYETKESQNIQSQGNQKWVPISSVQGLIDELKSKPVLDPKFEEEEKIELEKGAHGNRPFGQDQPNSDDESLPDDPEVDQTGSPMDTGEEEEAKKWPSPVPQDSYLVVERIVGYADRYLTHDSARLKLNLINLIRFSIPVLASNNEKFLPSVNNYWPVLVSRLTESDTFILEATLKTIGEISLYAKDFISRRFQNLWPTIKSLLPDSKRSRPELSSEQRILTAVCECLAQVLEFTPLPRYLFNDILHCIMPYIITNHPHVSQVKESLQNLNPDAVWLESLRGGLISSHYVIKKPGPDFVDFIL
jgi:hypothetical protein